ncbi:hypothetical protein [Guptibacillus hwajinpoensis]|uniref:Uncharacterized protein n=2 Tax=Guptibacillus hwajinpoensis TaxID=208199 RepID=A0A0J6FUV6_9BACL|nr:MULTISPECIES: hypothetical protein [Bacillaceae]KMM38122.1 hypothetical protein AB986_02005 [Alkalihalobacillus macyae]MDP4552659.1 hypothetical protein [Alkalihalobacillus macyae]MDQ0481942.1 hypothetical protein [Alkalihalobacillus hemicentroti]TKD69882.1 hypothetical protein FBF83_11460 [Pseudalkalibacillus hwajinpoensis]
MINKLKTKSLLGNEDLDFNRRLGMPVEVFCPKLKDTVAFGKIEMFVEDELSINGNCFQIEQYLFFGCPEQR